MAKKNKVVELEQVEAEGKALYAYADFEIEKLGISVKEGETFEPPADWKRDAAQEELLLASSVKQGKTVGMVFTYLGDVINTTEKNPELRERRVHNVVLPLEAR